MYFVDHLHRIVTLSNFGKTGNIHNFYTGSILYKITYFPA